MDWLGYQNLLIYSSNLDYKIRLLVHKVTGTFEKWVPRLNIFKRMKWFKNGTIERFF